MWTTWTLATQVIVLISTFLQCGCTWFRPLRFQTFRNDRDNYRHLYLSPRLIPHIDSTILNRLLKTAMDLEVRKKRVGGILGLDNLEYTMSTLDHARNLQRLRFDRFSELFGKNRRKSYSEPEPEDEENFMEEDYEEPVQKEPVIDTSSDTDQGGGGGENEEEGGAEEENGKASRQRMSVGVSITDLRKKLKALAGAGR